MPEADSNSIQSDQSQQSSGQQTSQDLQSTLARLSGFDALGDETLKRLGEFLTQNSISEGPSQNNKTSETVTQGEEKKKE